MDSVTRSTTRMLDTLTGKIPEKISQTSYPLPTLEELDGANSASTSSSILESLQNNWIALVAFLLLLAFTGFNIYAYKEQQKKSATGETETETETGTDKFNKTINDISTYIKKLIGNVSTADADADAIKPTTSAPPTPKTSASVPVPVPQKNSQIPGITSGKRVGQYASSLEEEEDDGGAKDINALNTALDSATKDSSYKAHDGLQSVKAKAGWCFVGAEKGFRNCVEVGETETCLSGDIFPTSQVCINPKLRA